VKVFKLGIQGMTLGYHTSDMVVLGCKSEWVCVCVCVMPVSWSTDCLPGGARQSSQWTTHGNDTSPCCHC